MKTLSTTLLLILGCAPLFAQWSPFTPDIPDTVGVISTDVVDDNTAWITANMYAVDSNGYTPAFGPRAYIFRTIDGGVSWSNDTAPLGPVPIISCLSGLDALNAWICGFDASTFRMQIHQTKDGGDTWTEKLTDGFKTPVSYVNIVHFWDAQNGIVCGDPVPQAPDTIPFFEIYRTADGGLTWSRVPKSALPAPLPGDFGLQNQFATVGNHFWFNTVQGQIYYSPDRGNTWQAYTSGFPTLGFISFADTLWGMCGNNLGPQQSTIGFTADGGKTWKDVTPLGGNYNLSSATTIPVSRYLLITVMYNPATGPYRTLISKDAGDTWLQISDGPNPGAASFISPTTGYAGDWQPGNQKTRLYSYTGAPLSGLFSSEVLDVDLQLYPNPASDYVDVNITDYPEKTDWLLLLNDSEGRLLRNVQISDTERFTERIQLADLPTGMYTLTVSNHNGSLSKVVQIAH